jgi:HNH endonuclease
MLKRRKFTPAERTFVELRAHGCCEYCKILHDFSPDTFNIEHIISLFEGGTNELINLAFSCGGCNNRKGLKIKAIDPIKGTIVYLFNPKEPISGYTIFNGKIILPLSKVLHHKAEQPLNY